MEQLKLYEQLTAENAKLRQQLEEANETITAIRTGQIDALVVKTPEGHQLYTLKSADQTYRVFIEKMNEGVVTLNAEGTILYCNSRFAEMAGMLHKFPIGEDFHNFIPPAEEIKQMPSSEMAGKLIAKPKLLFVTGKPARSPAFCRATLLSLMRVLL